MGSGSSCKFSVGFNNENSFCWLLPTFKHISRLGHLKKPPQLSHLQLPEHLGLVPWQLWDRTGWQTAQGWEVGKGKRNFPYAFGVNITFGARCCFLLWVRAGYLAPYNPSILIPFPELMHAHSAGSVKAAASPHPSQCPHRDPSTAPYSRGTTSSPLVDKER